MGSAASEKCMRWAVKLVFPHCLPAAGAHSQSLKYWKIKFSSPQVEPVNTELIIEFTAYPNMTGTADKSMLCYISVVMFSLMKVLRYIWSSLLLNNPEHHVILVNLSVFLPRFKI